MDNKPNSAGSMLSPAEYVIDIFGGLSATARILGKPVTTVQGWKARERIPTDHWEEIIVRAAEQGATLSVEDFLRRHELPTSTQGEVA